MALQGAVRAVSRILPREHLPRRESEVAKLPIPLYEDDRSAAPPFMVHGCAFDCSRSQDWGIIQCLHSEQGPQPVLYRHVPDWTLE